MRSTKSKELLKRGQAAKPRNPTKPKQGPVRGRLGQLGEMAFTLQASMLGFTVAQPCGEPEAYDRLVDNGNRCWRVQIKTTRQASDQNVYFVDCGHSGSTADGRKSRHIRYRDDEIDFLVVYVFPENRWFVIPWKALQGRTGLTIYSERSRSVHRNRGNLAQYEGAWHLMWEGGKKEKSRSGVMDLMANAEVPTEVGREFACEATDLAANDSVIPKGFRVWTAGEPPTQEAIGRILGVMLGESTTVPVRAGEIGSA